MLPCDDLPAVVGNMTATGNGSHRAITASPWGVDGEMAPYNRTGGGGLTSASSIVTEDIPDTSGLEYAEEFIYSRVCVVVAALGILGNILNIVVLTRRSLQRSMESRMEKSANIGLMSLAVSDLLLCITILPSGFVDQSTAEYLSYGFDLVYMKYRGGILNIFIMSSTWLTVFMALSRYVAICHPIKARDVIGLTFTKVSMVLIFVLCVFFNLPRFWFYITIPVPCSVQGYTIYFTGPYGYMSMSEHPRLYRAYMWTYFVVCILIPLVMLAVCNEFLIRALKESAKMRKEFQRKKGKGRANSSTHIVTRTLVAIVIFYIVLVVPAEVLSFLLDMVIPTTQDLLYKARINLTVSVLNMLQAVNFSFNFGLYCVTNVFFRRTLGELMRCRRSAHRSLVSNGETMTTYYSNVYPSQSNGRSMSCASRL